MIRKNSSAEKVNWHIGQRFGEKTDEDLCFYRGNWFTEREEEEVHLFHEL